MEIYNTEEQQVEALKKWWNENGTPILVGAILGVGLIGGWRFWQSSQEQTLVEASDAYEKMMAHINTDPDEFIKQGELIVKDFGDTVYANLTALHLAKRDVESGNLEQATQHLTSVVEGSQNEELKTIANMRLARIKVDQEQAEQALAILNNINQPAFKAEASLIKGDALVKLGRHKEALDAYRDAKSDTNEGVPGNPSLDLKIDDLGATLGLDK